MPRPTPSARKPCRGQTARNSRCSKFPTTAPRGLDGADGERNGSWFGLVQSGGVSINQDDAGGAFGIGKKAPFAGSFARTVFHSTLNRSGGRAFQGVTTLTTHLDASGEKTQAAGFIGLVEAGAARCGSVRDPEPA